MRVVLVGSVQSSLVVLEKLLEHQMHLVGVFGLAPPANKTISGYTDLRTPAEQAGVAFHTFSRINDEVEALHALAPDLIFIVGLSQLVSAEVIGSATHGCVGFHPTNLPRGRGRAPMAWLILREQCGAACFFRITEGVDDGPIYSQTPFPVRTTDDASSLHETLYAAMREGLDRWLPTLKHGRLDALEQDEAQATWYAGRTEPDGLIDWQHSADQIQRLIRASAAPHPGAYAWCGDQRLRIWRARYELEPRLEGVVGTVVALEPDGFRVQCGMGHLIVTQYSAETDWAPRVGQSLAVRVADEVVALRRRVAELENLVEQFTARLIK